eukprot:TRINITY_DN4283_c0_g1_i3.p1 TRINITY_DN4283_c0_g1~~TRINITY_DN4283_c0_g1_i3.p1  ORF type:complete len:705 (-),score=209.05 TRINITY_DN4283_c0_g1_i3:128-2242(-)
MRRPTGLVSFFSVLREDPASGKTSIHPLAIGSSSSSVDLRSSASDIRMAVSSIPTSTEIPALSNDDGDNFRSDSDRKRRDDDRDEDRYQPDDEQGSKRRRRDDDDRGYERREGRRERDDRDDRRGSNSRRNDRYDRDRRHRDYDGDNRRRRFNDDKRKQRCRDYDERGFCIRGELCPYDHGNDRIVVTDSYDPEKPIFIPRIPFVPPPLGVMPGAIGTGTFYDSQTREEDDGDVLIQVGGKGMYPKNDRPPRERRDRNDRNDRNDRGDRGDRGDRNDRGDREEKRKPVDSNPAHTTLAIANIPADLNTIDKLNGHFKAFGTVTNIQVKPALERAFIQFSSNEEAQSALNSPEAVLGNRFIKIFWAKRQYPPPSNDKPEPRPFPKRSAPESAAPFAQTPMQLQVTPKEDKAAILAKVQKLQKQKEEIRRSQLDQTKSILDQLSKAKNMDPKDKEALMKRVQSLTNTVANSIQKDANTLKKDAVVTPVKAPALVRQPSKEDKQKEILDRELDLLRNEPETTTENEAAGESNVEKLQKKYNSLQQVAASMGIDPTSPKRKPFGTPGGRPAKRPMALDNRTTTIVVMKIPDTIKDEDLQQHFQTFGEVSSVSRFGSDKSAALVRFADRRSAETALSKGKTIKSQTLPMLWHTPSVKTAAGTEQRSADDATKVEAEGEEEVVQEIYEGERDDAYSDEEGEGHEDRSWKR